MEETIWRRKKWKAATKRISVGSVGSVTTSVEYFNERMEDLLQNRCHSLHIHRDGEFNVILENIDEFCSALSSSIGVNSINIGYTEGLGFTKVEITEENAFAWDKLFLAICNISAVCSLALGDNLSGHVMARLVRSLPSVMTIHLHYPWHTVGGEDMHTFVEAISNHACHCIATCIQST